MRKKSKNEFYRFIDKIHCLDTLFLLIAKLELFHCERRLSGFFFYIFFIIVSFCMYNFFSAQTCYLYVLVLYFVIVTIYASFRNCFTNQENNIMILKFLKFHKIYIKLQRENTISNRNLFFQLYFLFFLVIIGAKKIFFFLYLLFKALHLIFCRSKSASIIDNQLIPSLAKNDQSVMVGSNF
nr:hypothetical protein [Trebouxia sp. A1-2]